MHLYTYFNIFPLISHPIHLSYLSSIHLFTSLYCPTVAPHELKNSIMLGLHEAFLRHSFDHKKLYYYPSDYNTNNVFFHTSSYHYRTTDAQLLCNFYTFKLLIPQLSATLHLNKKSLLKLKII